MAHTYDWHYLGETSPMAETLIRYGDFFALFQDFQGVHRLLPLAGPGNDSSAVKFFMPFADFGTSPLPPTVDAYQNHRRNAIRFVEARDRRMAGYVARL